MAALKSSIPESHYRFVAKQDLTSDDINEAAKLHRQAFSGLLFGALHYEFISRFFRKMADSDVSYLMVCKDQSRVVGFIAGAADKKSFYDIPLIKEFVCAAFKLLIRKPGFLIYFIRHALGLIRLSTIKENSELFSIAVHSEYQNQGIGSNLLVSFQDWLQTKGVSCYGVFTNADYSAGDLFYERNNFALGKKAVLLGQTVKYYYKMLA